MAKARSNGNGKLEDGMEELRRSQLAMQQAQAAMLQTLAAMQLSHAQYEKDMAQLRREGEELKRTSDERFARIEAILLEHNRILSRLPEAVAERIGFKAPDGVAKAEQ